LRSPGAAADIDPYRQSAAASRQRQYRDPTRIDTDLFRRIALLKLIHTTTPDTTRLSRLPVDRRRRRDAGQAGSYA